MPATTLKAPVPGIYIDNVSFDSSGDDVQAVNTVPEANETSVKTTSPIALWVVSLNDLTPAAVQDVQIYVTRDSVRALAYDQAGSGIQAAYNGSGAAATLQASPGSGVNDELLLNLVPTTPFTDLDIVTVEVIASDGSTVYTLSYSFTIEDSRTPRAIDTLWFTPRRVRLTFNKPVELHGNVGGAYYYKTISGLMEFEAPNKVKVRGFTPTSDLIGMWLTTTGSIHPRNNDGFKIDDVDVTDKLIYLNISSSSTGRSVKDDTGIDYDSNGSIAGRRTLRGTISPYRFESRASTIADERNPKPVAYEPPIKSVRAPRADELPAGVEADRYVVLELLDDISINRPYTVHVSRVLDDQGQEADDDSTYDFTTPPFDHPDNRVQIYDWFEHATTLLLDDFEHDQIFHAFIEALQDYWNTVWYRVDRVQFIDDPMLVDEKLLDYALDDAGNPFDFTKTVPYKRKVLSIMPSIRQRKGTALLIHDIIEFILGVDVEVRPYREAQWWVLGTSVLGVTTVLGPDTAYMRNAWEIVAPRELTAHEIEVITEIGRKMDPYDMHLVRIVLLSS